MTERPAAAALLDAIRALPPLPTCTLERLADERADVVRYRLESAEGLVGEVLVEPSADDDWQASFDAAGDPYFGELYEVIGDLGDAAAWAPLSHTLRIRVGNQRITVDLEVPFGTEPRPEQLEVAVAGAREALRAL